MWSQEPDGTVLDETGNVIFFSTERFVKDICLGECCFMCGATPGSKPFNDEHVLPEWLLRRYDLFDKSITLPNGHALRYDRYTVPCCADCNALMGVEIEQRVSEVTSHGATAISDYLISKCRLLFFVWMGLIFLKTHLRDRAHRFHLDSREGGGLIADDYEWEDLHHIHTVVRSFCVGSFLEPHVLGSFLVIPAHSVAATHRFDFGDLLAAQTMMLRLDDVAMFAVFNDAGGVLAYLEDRLKLVTGPLCGLQSRELLAEAAFLNLHIKIRPRFGSVFDPANERHLITASLPDLALKELEWPMRGALLERAMGDLSRIEFNDKTPAQVAELMAAGTLTFLFNDKGEFIRDGMKPLGSGRPPKRAP